MKKLLIIGSVLLLAGCAGNMALVATSTDFVKNPNTTSDLRVTVEEEGAPADLPVSVNDDRPILPVDLRFRIAITNTTQEPVTVRQVTLMYEDPGRQIPRMTRNYSKTIAGGATEKIAFWTEMQANDASTWRPAYVYTQIEFEGSQGKRVEYFKSPARPRDYRRASEVLR